MTLPARFRFADFEVSQRERRLRRQGRELPLIPRYFDLLVLLIERRPAVVTRRDIFDQVWGDVIVSDGALSQAIRTLRRTLGDDSREPAYIRTISRHGYSFAYADVREDTDDDRPGPAPGDAPAPAPQSSSDIAVPSTDDRIEALVAALVGEGSSDARSIEDRRDIAQQLHQLGTARALQALARHADGGAALALLRDSRWDVPGAGEVPLWGQSGGLAAARVLVRLRAMDALTVIGRRWTRAASGGGTAGLVAGCAGGVLLWLAPASEAPATAAVVLGALGAAAGTVAAAGVAAGMTTAEAVSRSRRGLAIVAGGAAGGFGTGVLLSTLGRLTLEALFGLRVELGGPVEGLVIGAAVAAGYALSTPRPGGGIAALTGSARRVAALASGGCGAAAGLLLSWAGHSLVGGTIHAVALASQGSQIALTPLGALLGEPLFGPVTQALVAAFEGGAFGLGLAWGLSSPAARRGDPNGRPVT
ncbi:MAG TPA: winged helix-turn-helix domain-containing protein [Vicinamibacterales bacterium]|nr:winged helix-turn-helix domain-containing protein [Vicinamibacterales bacterium]